MAEDLAHPRFAWSWRVVIGLLFSRADDFTEQWLLEHLSQRFHEGRIYVGRGEFQAPRVSDSDRSRGGGCLR